MIKINEETIEREDFERTRDILEEAFNYINETGFDIHTDFIRIDMINRMLCELKICHDRIETMLTNMVEE